MVQVVTKRTKNLKKQEIPSLDDPISKLNHIGKETVKKLNELKAAADEADLDLRLPSDLFQCVPPSLLSSRVRWVCRRHIFSQSWACCEQRPCRAHQCKHLQPVKTGAHHRQSVLELCSSRHVCSTGRIEHPELAHGTGVNSDHLPYQQLHLEGVWN